MSMILILFDEQFSFPKLFKHKLLKITIFFAWLDTIIEDDDAY